MIPIGYVFAKSIESSTPELLECWEAHVVADLIAMGSSLREPVLQPSMPAFMRVLVDFMAQPEGQDEWSLAKSKIARVHTHENLHTAHCEVAQIIREYSLLRKTLIEYFVDQRPSTDVAARLAIFIDQGIAHAVR